MENSFFFLKNQTHIFVDCPQYNVTKMKWTRHHVGKWRFAWQLVLNTCATHFKFITIARIKAILKMKQNKKKIVYTLKSKLPSTTYVFMLLFQHKAFTY